MHGKGYADGYMVAEMSAYIEYPLHPCPLCGDAADALEQQQKTIETLFDQIKHGDEDHREWLREAINNHFDGKPVPAPRGGNTKDKRILEMEQTQRNWGKTDNAQLNARIDEMTEKEEFNERWITQTCETGHISAERDQNGEGWVLSVKPWDR